MFSLQPLFNLRLLKFCTKRNALSCLRPIIVDLIYSAYIAHASGDSEFLITVSHDFCREDSKMTAGLIGSSYN